MCTGMRLFPHFFSAGRVIIRIDSTPPTTSTMSKAVGPDLRRYMDKKLAIRLNANRRVSGILRGFDQFMNLVLEDTVEEVSSTEKNELGMVVIRGNSVILIEPLERA